MPLDSMERQVHRYTRILADELRPLAVDEVFARSRRDMRVPLRRSRALVGAFAVVMIAVAMVAVVLLRNTEFSNEPKGGVPPATPSSRDWVVPYVPDPSVKPGDEAPERDGGAVPLPRAASPETQAKAEQFQALLPPGWTMQGAGETVFPDGQVTQSTWFKHEDGISVLSVIWEQLSKPIDILPAPGSPDAGSVGHERAAEGEFVVQSLQPGEIQLGLVRPDGRSINLAYGIAYTPEQNKPKIDAEGGPAGKLDEASLRALAIEATR